MCNKKDDLLDKIAVDFMEHDLPQDEESPARALKFRDLMRNSGNSQRDRNTVVAVYHSAGNGKAAVSFHDTLMLLTAVEVNPAMLPFIETDIEKILLRWDGSGNPCRPAWDHIRHKLLLDRVNARS